MATAESRISPEEYLALERASLDRRSEYVNGRIYAMSGASMEHNQIVVNLVGELRSLLRGGPCRPFAIDMRTKAAATEMYTYPDVVVVCGEPRMEDDYLDTLLNPTVIIEVLSLSTERFDRGDKWLHYRRIDSLRTYVLVTQHRPYVELFARDGEQWVLSEVAGDDAVLELGAIGVALPLALVYEGVNQERAERRLDPDRGPKLLNVPVAKR